MLKIGLIGAGFMGYTHAEVYKLLSFTEDIRLQGIYDIERDKAMRAARLSSSTVFNSAEQLLESDEIDAIDICLPTYLHCEYAKKAMAAGKDLFIEKPVVLTPQEGAELLECKRKYGSRIMVGQCLRLWEEYNVLKDIHDSKKYGRLKHLTLKRLSSKPDWGYENWYLDFEKSGGVLLDLHIHDLDYMRYLLGEPDSCKISGDGDHVYTIFEYDSGVDVQIESGWDFPKNFPVEVEYRADFEGAIVCYKGDGVTVYENTGRHFTVRSLREGDPNDHIALKAKQYGGYYNELQYFVQCINGGKRIEIATLHEGIKTIELIHKELSDV